MSPMRGEKLPKTARDEILKPNFTVWGFCTHSIRRSGPNLARKSEPKVYNTMPNFTVIGKTKAQI